MESDDLIARLSMLDSLLLGKDTSADEAISAMCEEVQDHIAALAAEIAGLKAALVEAQHVPEGWWVAPKEATQEMIGAAVGCGWGGFAIAYRAMRDAAPQPPQEASHDPR